MTSTGAEQAKPGFFRELIGVIVPALLIAVGIQTFLFQPFRIPSGSMRETLLVGDYLFVSKFSYGYSRHSFPFSLAPISGRILASPPQRGDVVVFRLPRDTSQDYIKRVIGLPGDTIQVRHSALYINGEPVKRERIDDFIDKETSPPSRIERWRETLPNGVSYDTLNISDDEPLDNTPVYRVPPGHYFMMGDNRDDSADSRVLSEVGYVPFENLVGRAQIIFFSIAHGAGAWEVWRWPQDLRLRRMFTWIR
ncbi:MAG: signal peptidase I [Rhizobiales bacterium]|nr:signal peptidase I [Hyphomicrobiales bacterium]